MFHLESSSNKPKFAPAWCGTLLCVLVFTALGRAQDQTDLTQLSPEQLSKIEVTSVSKKEQKLSDTAAAVYVITRQDISNSPATSIPELLRMVPGLEVAQINEYQWAVSARGFAEQYANKMLVLLDGRSLFDPLFSGVVWREQTIPLEDIERIEIIRGPGATVWGTNAVNGVINIITRETKDTPGTLVSAGAGDQERSQGFVQYGGKFGESTHYRIYSRYSDNGPGVPTADLQAHDSFRSTSGGFRLDSQASKSDRLMLEGAAFNNTSGFDDTSFSYTPPFNSRGVSSLFSSGENMLASWTHKYLTGSETNVLVSVAHDHQDQSGRVDVTGTVMTVAAQHEFTVGSRHSFVSGVEYDFRTASLATPSTTILLAQPDSRLSIGGAFLQDEILFANGDVRLTAGIRAEHNSLSGTDFQPSVRLLWKVRPRQSVWIAYGLGNRGASISDTSLSANLVAFSGPAGTQVLRYEGNPEIKPEKVNAFELGYRIQPGKALWFDVATFYNKYSDLVGNSLGQAFFENGPPSRLVIPLVAQNNVEGETYGAELSARWLPRPWLRLATSYSLLKMDLRDKAPILVPTAGVVEGQSPQHQLFTSVSADLTKKLRMDSDLSFRDRLRFGNVAGYTVLDSKLTWHPRQIDFSVGGKNLLNKQHLEFVSTQDGFSTFLGRTVYGKATWHF